MYKVNYEVNREIFNDERIFEDVVFQRDEDGELVWDEKKLNKYSKALRIEVGTEFDDIYEWVMFVQGRNIVACIKHDSEKNKRFISYFKPEDSEIKDGEKLMNIETVEIKDYTKDGATKQFIKIFLREVVDVNQDNLGLDDNFNF